MVDMSDILSRAAKDVEAPKTLPVGIYLWVVTNVITHDQNGNLLKSMNGNQKIEFECETSIPVEVDAEAIQGFHFPAKIRYRFTVTENSLFRLVQFLARDLGLPEDLPVRDLIPMATGRTFKGQVGHTPGSKAGDNKLYANIVDSMPA
jgi:hypothetical protein